MALSMIYAAYGRVPAVAALFFGLKAAILAVVVEAVVRIGKRALKTPAMTGVAAAAFVAIFVFHVPFPALIAAAALAGVAANALKPELVPAPQLPRAGDGSVALLDRALTENALPHVAPDTGRALRTAALWLAIWLAPVAAGLAVLGPGHVLSKLGTFFSQVAVVTFGGAYAVLAYVAQQAVTVYGWLSPAEMLDGLALAETTPGPLIMVLQFVGYLAAYRADIGLAPPVAGLIGATLTVWVTFAPSFLWIFVGAPYVEALLGRRWLHAALSCITAAVVGVILNLSVWFALHVVFATVTERRIGPLYLNVPDFATLDLAALTIAAASLAAILRFKLGVGPTLIAAAAAGFVWTMAIA